MSDLVGSIAPALIGGISPVAVVNNINTANQINTRKSWVVGVISGIIGTVFGILGLGVLIGIAVGIGSFIVGGLLTYGFGKLENWITFGSKTHKHNHQQQENNTNQHQNEIEKLPEMTKGLKEFEKVVLIMLLKFSDCLTSSAVKTFLKEEFPNFKVTEIDEFIQNMQSRIKDKNSLFFIESAAKDKNLLHRKLSSKNPDELKKYLEDSSNFNQVLTSFNPNDFASFVKNHSDFPKELMLKYEQGVSIINAGKESLQKERSKGPQSVASQTEPEPNTHQENLLKEQNKLMSQFLHNMPNQQPIPPHSNNNYAQNNPQAMPPQQQGYNLPQQNNQQTPVTQAINTIKKVLEDHKEQIKKGEEFNKLIQGLFEGNKTNTNTNSAQNPNTGSTNPFFDNNNNDKKATESQQNPQNSTPINNTQATHIEEESKKSNL
jgi:hypothetical protein